MDYRAPHETRDSEKLESMIATLRAGKQLPPVVVIGDVAITGSHRLAAWAALDMEPNVVELSEGDYIAAMDAHFGPDWQDYEIGDYNAFCTTLYEITQDSDVRAALQDQRE